MEKQKTYYKELKIRQAAVDIRKYLQWRGKDVKVRGKKIALSKKSKKKVLGSIKISADLMIGMEAIKELINKAIYRGNKWKNLAVKHVDIWFENPNNKRWELCPVIKKGMKSSMGRSFCKMKVVRSTKKGMELAYKSLVRMQGNIAKHDYKKFVENSFKIINRQALHAKSLGFIHPKTKKEVFFDSDLPKDIRAVIEKWKKYELPENY